MAKKKAAKATTRKKAPQKRKQSRKAVEQALAGPLRRTATAPKRPKDQALPGVQARSPRLDRICSSLYDVRTQVNDLKGQDAGLVAQAARVMQDEKIHLHRAHHIELVLKSGEAKVTARLTKADATTEDDGDDGRDRDPGSDDDLDNGAETGTDGTESGADA